MITLNRSKTAGYGPWQGWPAVCEVPPPTRTGMSGRCAKTVYGLPDALALSAESRKTHIYNRRRGKSRFSL